MASALALGTCARSPEPADISGHWVGNIAVAGMEIEIEIDFERVADSNHLATIDIPAQGAFGLELTDITISGDSISFSLPSNLGTAFFRGTTDSGVMSGLYEQSGYVGTFELVLQAPEGGYESSSTTYESVDVEIDGDGYVLAGTLTIPGTGEPPFPGLVLFTGSGGQDRDENVFGFKVFATLADHLTSGGLAVLRCDDRGVGGSTGATEAATDSLFALDAELMLDYMLSHPDVDPSRTGMLGHSEGSTVAFMVAAARPDDVAFVVAMAGPAVSGYDILLSQIESLSRLSGLDDSEISEKVELQRRIMDAVLSGEGVTHLDTLFEDQIRAALAELSDVELAAIGDLDTYVDAAVAQSLAEIASPWFESFIRHDPANEIGAVRCPVLMLYGSLDIQVTPEVNAGPAEAALTGNPDYSVVVIEGANHLFQQAVTGSVDEYAVLDREFIDGFPDTLTNWILPRIST